MEQIWKIINQYSFSKDETSKIYTDCLMRDIDFTKPANYDVKTFSLAAVIWYEIETYKGATTDILDYINTQFLSEKEKISNIMDDIYEVIIKDLNIPDFINKIQKDQFDSLKNDLYKLLDYQWSKVFSLIYFDVQTIIGGKTLKNDIEINSVWWYKKLYNWLEELKLQCEERKKQWYEIMLWPYISDIELAKMKWILSNMFDNMK